MMITHASGFVNIDGVKIVDDTAELLPCALKSVFQPRMANSLKRSKQRHVVNFGRVLDRNRSNQRVHKTL